MRGFADAQVRGVDLLGPVDRGGRVARVRECADYPFRAIASFTRHPARVRVRTGGADRVAGAAPTSRARACARRREVAGAAEGAGIPRVRVCVPLITRAE
ncbi:hypothetical protein SSP531S_20650 [Streptomyces spongiicola]|uniref:Uncharacterized protein n=1 Tax=Streptomyces spongiicola TaxID=1690221 RepID=A0A388SVI3_9ACTN|nr:hypothetical protein SSP531S_20650 [Streptomyces spongiicola]